MQSVERIIDSGVVVIVGPTAVGKTAVAVELVSIIGGEIVSADSVAVYKGMDIGTAKPTDDEKARARFHLMDVADPADQFSVGEFARLAHNAIDDILATDPPAIVVGGSGLYVRAAIDGLDNSIPASDKDYRENLNRLAREHSVEYVHSMLAEVDAVSAERIHPNNLKRVIQGTGDIPLHGREAVRYFRGGLEAAAALSQCPVLRADDEPK